MVRCMTLCMYESCWLVLLFMLTNLNIIRITSLCFTWYVLHGHSYIKEVVTSNYTISGYYVLCMHTEHYIITATQVSELPLVAQL